MKSNELAYWLMGFFELGPLAQDRPNLDGSPAEWILQREHYQCIQKHIELVKTFEGDKVAPFVHLLEGIIAGYLATKDLVHGGDERTVNTSKEVYARLQSLFVHEIDPSYGEEKQEAMNQAHTGTPPRPRPRPNGLLRDEDRRLRC